MNEIIRSAGQWAALSKRGGERHATDEIIELLFRLSTSTRVSRVSRTPSRGHLVHGSTGARGRVVVANHRIPCTCARLYTKTRVAFILSDTPVYCGWRIERAAAIAQTLTVSNRSTRARIINCPNHHVGVDRSPQTKPCTPRLCFHWSKGPRRGGC